MPKAPFYNSSHLTVWDSHLKPTEKETEEGRGERMGAQRERENVRKYRSGETLLNSLLQEWNIFSFFFSSIRSPVSVADIIFDFSMRFFLSNY